MSQGLIKNWLVLRLLRLLKFLLNISQEVTKKLVSAATAVEVPCGGSVSSSTILENVKFETASAVLRASSFDEIDRIANELKSSSGTTARLVGHTDNVGSDASNQTLSNNRARAVYNALIERGIASNRLSYEGKGETSPIATNATANGRQQNRRTEMVTSGGTVVTSGDDCDKYTNRTYRKLVSAATTQLVEIPARYESRTYRKMVNAASTQSVTVPARYESRTYRKLTSGSTTQVVEVPAQYKSRTYRKLVTPATSNSVDVPARYETRTYQKLVTPATSRSVDVPARYESRTYQKLVSAATTQTVEVPAQYKSRTYRKLVSPATTRSETVPARYESRTYRKLASAAATQVVDVPARYESRTYQKLASSATTTQSDVAAQYKTRNYQKLVSPATTRVEEVPAQYQTRTYQKLVSAASTRTEAIPAQYKTVTKRQLVSKGGMSEWKEVVCNSNVTPQLTRAVQDALRARGYNPGPSDNIMGESTKAALIKFQREQGLPIGQLDFETLKALGVNY